MEFVHSGAARLLMVTINILSHDDDIGLLGQVSQSIMRGVGLILGDELAAPIVPAPHQFRFGHEGSVGGQFFWAVLAPQGVFSTAKSGNSAGG